MLMITSKLLDILKEKDANTVLYKLKKLVDTTDEYYHIDIEHFLEKMIYSKTFTNEQAEDIIKTISNYINNRKEKLDIYSNYTIPILFDTDTDYTLIISKFNETITYEKVKLYEIKTKFLVFAVSYGSILRLYDSYYRYSLTSQHVSEFKHNLMAEFNTNIPIDISQYYKLGVVALFNRLIDNLLYMNYNDLQDAIMFYKAKVTALNNSIVEIDKKILNIINIIKFYNSIDFSIDCCCICLERKKFNGLTICGHSICDDCYNSMTKKTECPICKFKNEDIYNDTDYEFSLIRIEKSLI